MNELTLKEIFAAIFYGKKFPISRNPPFSGEDIIRFYERNLSATCQEKVRHYFITKFCKETPDLPETIEPYPLPISLQPPPLPSVLLPAPLPSALLPAPLQILIEPPQKLLPPPGYWFFIIPKFLPPYFLNILKQHMEGLVTSEAMAYEVLHTPVPEYPYLTTREEMYEDLSSQIDTLVSQNETLVIQNTELHWAVTTKIEKWTAQAIFESEQEWRPEQEDWIEEYIQEGGEEEEEVYEEDAVIGPNFDRMSDWEVFVYLEENLDYEMIEYQPWPLEYYKIHITDINWGVGWYDLDDIDTYYTVPEIVQQYVTNLENYLNQVAKEQYEQKEV